MDLPLDEYSTFFLDAIPHNHLPLIDRRKWGNLGCAGHPSTPDLNWKMSTGDWPGQSSFLDAIIVQ